MFRLEEQEVSRSSVNGSLIGNTCYGAEVALLQFRRDLGLMKLKVN